MPDFTIKTYEHLLTSLINQGFLFQSFTDSIGQLEKRAIFLRHDVDRLPENSLKFARIQAEKGIIGTYYFRIIPESFDEKVIKEIYSLGHEVGYHYEDFSLAAGRQKTKDKRQKIKSKITSDLQYRKIVRVQDKWHLEKELADIAIESFTKNLQRLREIVPVKTICMHGSPMSRWDSRLLWEYYDYRDFGIVGEPYFDIDFNEVLYLTDTGRRWDGESVNIRDKAIGDRQKEEGSSLEFSRQPPAFSPQPYTPFPQFHSTLEIIQASEEGRLPDKIMMTFHPQRWTDKPVPWVKELVWQNVKNVAKYFIIKVNS